MWKGLQTSMMSRVKRWRKLGVGAIHAWIAKAKGCWRGSKIKPGHRWGSRPSSVAGRGVLISGYRCDDAIRGWQPVACEKEWPPVRTQFLTDQFEHHRHVGWVDCRTGQLLDLVHSPQPKVLGANGSALLTRPAIQGLMCDDDILLSTQGCQQPRVHATARLRLEYLVF